MNPTQIKIIPLGECFSFATKLGITMLTEGILEGIKVVHGIVHPKWHPRPYWHAWVEANGRVYDWQMKATVGSLPLEDFYKEFNPTKIVKYTPARALGNTIKSKHCGPWNEENLSSLSALVD